MFMAAPEPTPAVAVRNISKSFGARAVLVDVSLTVARGEIHGLLGANGSGKTTLLRIIAGICQADSGAVDHQHGGGAMIGYAAQRFCLYDELTVGENLRFQARMRGCPQSSVADFEQQFELQLLDGQRAGRLSGGQRQRLLLAAALLHRPSLLLLDEPTTALDDESRQSLWQMLRREADHGTAIVLTTHETLDSLQCDVVTRLKDGRVPTTAG